MSPRTSHHSHSQPTLIGTLVIHYQENLQAVDSKNERSLKEQLVELTIVRDSVAHPRLYLVKQAMHSDFSFSKPRAELLRGAELRHKAFRRKLKGSERTKSLRLPLVSSWIGYPDAVICVLVLYRFLNLLERKYGNPYAWVGNFFVRNNPTGFFKDTEETKLCVSMENGLPHSSSLYRRMTNSESESD